MNRVRERQDYFQWRGDRYAFHQLVDGPSLARLDPYCDDEQRWPLHSRRIIFPTGSEVRDIARQVQGLELPYSRPEPMAFAPVEDIELEGRVSSLEERVAKLEALLAKRDEPEPEPEPEDEFHIPETPPLGYADEAEPEPEPEPAPEPYTPNFTIIPEQLAKYAEADEDVSAFRNRLKSYWQRFGIDEGMNFPGGGEPLTGEEKIQMRDIDMLLNSEEGRNARLHDWLFAD